MKLYTLRDNVARLGGDPVTIITSTASILNGLLTLFGGGEGAGEWVNGRFVPGDINNRLQFIASRMQQYGVTQYDLNRQELENIVYSPGVWQGQVDNYIISVYLDKKQNPQNYPKYKTEYNSGSNTSDSNTSAGLQLGNLGFTEILLIGAGVYFVAKLLGTGKKRGR
ncbi:MAG: hypothetical protein AB1432_11665 [Bacteroidota bacterium]|jgi:hypothetical protein